MCLICILNIDINGVDYKMVVSIRYACNSDLDTLAYVHSQSLQAHLET